MLAAVGCLPGRLTQSFIPDRFEPSVVFLCQAIVASSVHLQLFMARESPRGASVSPTIQMYLFLPPLCSNNPTFSWQSGSTKPVSRVVLFLLIHWHEEFKAVQFPVQWNLMLFLGSNAPLGIRIDLNPLLKNQTSCLVNSSILNVTILPLTFFLSH